MNNLLLVCVTSKAENNSQNQACSLCYSFLKKTFDYIFKTTIKLNTKYVKCTCKLIQCKHCHCHNKKKNRSLIIIFMHVFSYINPFVVVEYCCIPVNSSRLFWVFFTYPPPPIPYIQKVRFKCFNISFMIRETRDWVISRKIYQRSYF